MLLWHQASATPNCCSAQSRAVKHFMKETVMSVISQSSFALGRAVLPANRGSGLLAGKPSVNRPQPNPSMDPEQRRILEKVGNTINPQPKESTAYERQLKEEAALKKARN